MKKTEQILNKYVYKIYNIDDFKRSEELHVLDFNWGIALKKVHILGDIFNYKNCCAIYTNTL